MSRSSDSSQIKRVGEGSCKITLGGQSLSLLPERGVYWAERRILFVADLHLGKDATFRQAGLAVPAVSSRDSLSRLQKLIEVYEPAECIILGDLIHAADSLNERVHVEISDFFSRVPKCKWRLIKGNHDRHTKKWPQHWPLVIEVEGGYEEPFRLLHIPPISEETDGDLKPGRSSPGRSSPGRSSQTSDLIAKAEEYFLAGHIHPAWSVKGSVLVREKLACFWLTSRGLILPAFGTFTGTKAIAHSSSDRVFVLADTKVIEV